MQAASNASRRVTASRAGSESIHTTDDVPQRQRLLSSPCSGLYSKLLPKVRPPSLTCTVSSACRSSSSLGSGRRLPLLPAMLLPPAASLASAPPLLLVVVLPLLPLVLLSLAAAPSALLPSVAPSLLASCAQVGYSSWSRSVPSTTYGRCGTKKMSPCRQVVGRQGRLLTNGTQVFDGCVALLPVTLLNVTNPMSAHCVPAPTHLPLGPPHGLAMPHDVPAAAVPQARHRPAAGGGGQAGTMAGHPRAWRGTQQHAQLSVGKASWSATTPLQFEQQEALPGVVALRARVG